MRWFNNYPNKISKKHPTSEVRKQSDHIIVHGYFDYLDESSIFVA